jgi:uncharacterized protein DUF1761
MISINYLAVLVVAVLNMILGSLWYGPLFGKSWGKMMAFTDEHMKRAKEKGMGASYVVMAIGSVLMAWVLALFISSGEAHYAVWTFTFGIHIAFYLWIGLVAPVTVGTVIWEGKPWKLWVLNAGYYLVGLCLMGAILAVWH